MNGTSKAWWQIRTWVVLQANIYVQSIPCVLEQGRWRTLDRKKRAFPEDSDFFWSERLVYVLAGESNS